MSTGILNQDQKIFVLGDSRTGTSTLHRFFLSLGLKSIHHYQKESSQSQPDHENHEDNWKQLRQFIETSGIDAFSDYPTRLFYKELSESYPSAYFILSTRKDVDTWSNSMLNFFSKFNIDLNIEQLSRYYLQINEDIRQHFSTSSNNFIEICIDDDNLTNSNLIKEFLSIESTTALGWENRSSDYDNRIYSKRKRIYNTDNNILSYIESVCHGSKAMLSEYGWVFLVNDTNRFLYYQYGLEAWSEDDSRKAIDVFRKRNDYFSKQGIKYYKFIIPEKSIIYEEYMPYATRRLQTVDTRPAIQLSCAGLENVHYLESYLKDLKSYGLIYFRGDTHTNWLGSFFVYLYIIETIRNTVPGKIDPPFALSSLKAEIAAYDGDIYNQLNIEYQKDLNTVWKYVQSPVKFEILLKYSLPADKCTSFRVETPDYYLNSFNKRETFIYETSNTDLPRAVIFRDSTMDFNIELVAQHFSRSVFIWHEGNIYKEVVEHEKPDIVLHVMSERFLYQYKFRVPINSMTDFLPTEVKIDFN